MISERKARHLDVTTTFTYSHANTPLGQSERAYYLSYFINVHVTDEKPMQGCAAGKGMVCYLFLVSRVYNFEIICPKQRISCMNDLICYMNPAPHYFFHAAYESFYTINKTK